jgi:hypothetical protein
MRGHPEILAPDRSGSREGPARAKPLFMRFSHMTANNIVRREDLPLRLYCLARARIPCSPDSADDPGQPH